MGFSVSSAPLGEDARSDGFDVREFRHHAGRWEHRLTRRRRRADAADVEIELFAAIRRDLAAGMSGRAIEEKHRVGRRTVSAAMVSALPPPRKAMPPPGIEACSVQACD
jgi:hypothetical protein